MRMNRRRFLARAGSGLLGSLAATAPLSGYSTAPRPLTNPAEMSQPGGSSNAGSHSIKLFLCGDVMIGRGVDQILPHPSKPHLFEPYVRSALDYVEIAEQHHGPIRRPVDFAYIWGDALAELERARPDARIINLETAITTAEDAWPRKGIHYRMHPANAATFAAARIDCCILANNHVLDWGYAGLAETLDTLRRAGIRTAGAGRDEGEAAAPATIELQRGTRILVFAFGSPSAGVPRDWAAGRSRAGVNFLDLSKQTADGVARGIHALKRPGDIIVASIHWGGNWGYPVERTERNFAHQLIDTGGVDIVHGHSSHHPEGNRDLSRQAYPLRLRRLSERLRGHPRPRIIPFRSYAYVFPDARCSDRKAFAVCAGADADPTLPCEPGLRRRGRLARGDVKS